MTRAASSPQGVTVASADLLDAALIAQGRRPIASFPAPSWVSGRTESQPSARSGYSTVWTGQDLMIRGGHVAPGSFLASGGSHRPATDRWTSISPLGAPAARSGHTATWSGQEMIAWGGFAAAGFLGTGGRYQSALPQWIPLSNTMAPSGRVGHPPTMSALTVPAQPGRPLKVYLPRLLELAQDEDGDALRVSAVANLSANGAAVHRQGTWLIYDPAGQHTLPDTLTYEVTDERASASGTLTIEAAQESEDPGRNRVSVRLEGEDAVVAFAGIPNRTYRIQTTSALGTAWQNVGTATADRFGRFLFIEVGGAHSASRYYRTQTP